MVACRHNSEHQSDTVKNDFEKLEEDFNAAECSTVTFSGLPFCPGDFCASVFPGGDMGSAAVFLENGKLLKEKLLI